jgi:hypothetical protein
MQVRSLIAPWKRATVQALALSDALRWEGVATVCDVGGGTGAALRVLLRHHPHLIGLVYDLPNVVAEVEPSSERLQTEGGDFFTSVPSGYDLWGTETRLAPTPMIS